MKYSLKLIYQSTSNQTNQIINNWNSTVREGDQNVKMKTLCAAVSLFQACCLRTSHGHCSDILLFKVFRYGIAKDVMPKGGPSYSKVVEEHQKSAPLIWRTPSQLDNACLLFVQHWKVTLDVLKV